MKRSIGIPIIVILWCTVIAMGVRSASDLLSGELWMPVVYAIMGGSSLILIDVICRKMGAMP